MADIVFVFVTAVFFLIGIGYVAYCARLMERGGR